VSRVGDSRVFGRYYRPFYSVKVGDTKERSVDLSCRSP
jgi:hypothetical protein